MATASFDEILRAHPGDRPALLHDDGHITYRALRERVAAFAQRLRRGGVRPGERVIVCLPNGPDAVVALLGAVAGGAVAVPVHEDETRQLDELAEVAGATCRVAADATGVALRDCRPSAAASQPAPPDTALIRFSSGYTGAPKGVCLGRRQMWHMARLLHQAARLNPDHRELVVAPIAFSGAWQRLAATLSAGGAIAFGAPGPLTVRGLLDDLQARAATGLFATPSILRILLAAPLPQVAAGLAGCRSVEIGSASLAPTELAAFLDVCPGHVLVHYGLTECSRATLLDARARPDKLHTVGRAAAGVHIVLADDHGRPAVGRREGEILLKGPQLTSGYWRNDVLNAERFVDGWLRTRDRGEFDDDGFLVYRGRTDDLINCGGQSFFPAEIERLIGRVDGVREYVVAGVDDPRGLYGQVPWVFVQPLDPATYRSRCFLQTARQRVPSTRCPRRVVIVDAIPRTRSGKADRLRTAALFGPQPAQP